MSGMDRPNFVAWRIRGRGLARCQRTQDVRVFGVQQSNPPRRQWSGVAIDGRDGPVDARYLTQPERDAFKHLVCARRDEVERIIKRMQTRRWYTDDAVLQNLRASWHSLHAAVQSLGAVDGTPVKRDVPGPKYPL